MVPPTGTMNFKFSAAMQIRKPHVRIPAARPGNLPRITTRDHGSDVLIVRVNHFRCVDGEYLKIARTAFLQPNDSSRLRTRNRHLEQFPSNGRVTRIM
jgi:hypothetical protein